MAPERLDLPAMRRVASGVLIALAALYVCLVLLNADSLTLRLLQAAAGAGVVGALADWFAVVALFRHPLGLPIPHTALLPRNQTRVAHSVGTFIEENFLTAELVRTRILTLGVTRHAAHWGLDLLQSGRFVRSALDKVSGLLRSDTPAGLQHAFVVIAGDVLKDPKTQASLAGEVTNVLHKGVDTEALSELLAYLRDTVSENHDEIGKLVSANSRWWIASRLDKNATELIVNGVVAVIDELLVRDSPLRADLENMAHDAIQTLAATHRLQHAIGQAVEGYTGAPEFEQNISQLVATLKLGVASALENPQLEQLLTEFLTDIATDLAEDTELQNRFDAQLADMAEHALPKIRPVVGAFVAETIADWDSDQLVERFEREAGRDLQFIRINGAVLGFFIGGALFALEHMLG